MKFNVESLWKFMEFCGSVKKPREFDLDSF